MVGHRRSYGDVAASGSARVVAGDYNVHMERPTFNVSCPCLCDPMASRNHAVHAGQQTSLVFFQRPGDTDHDDNRHNKTYTDRRNRIHPANRLSEAAEQDYRTKKAYAQMDITHLRASPARSVASSTERRKHTDAVIKPADSADQHFSEHFTTQDKIANSVPDSRPTGKDYQHQTRVVPSQNLNDLQTSVTFRDDLTKPCIFAREDGLHRLFLLRRETPDWTRSVCTESFMPASRIKERINYGPNTYRRRKQNIQRTLGKLEPQRRRVLECLLEKVNHCDPHGYRWFTVAIDIENYEFTKRTGSVDTFSVVLARTLDDPR